MRLEPFNVFFCFCFVFNFQYDLLFLLLSVIDQSPKKWKEILESSPSSKKGSIKVCMQLIKESPLKEEADHQKERGVPTKKRKTIQTTLQLSPLKKSKLDTIGGKDLHVATNNIGTEEETGLRKCTKADEKREGAGKRKKNQKNQKACPTNTRQLFLDFGQERFDWNTCSVCGMTFAPGVPDDEKTHTRFHKAFLKMNENS